MDSSARLMSGDARDEQSPTRETQTKFACACWSSGTFNIQAGWTFGAMQRPALTRTCSRNGGAWFSCTAAQMRCEEAWLLARGEVFEKAEAARLYSDEHFD